MLKDWKGIAATYKKGLATVKEQLITYRKNEVLFSEEVAVLKREVACKDYEINVLKSKFEKVKQEKEGIDFKIEKFDKASKDLDKLLGSQITDKSKKGLGYNAIPQPHPLIYNRLKKLDLSYSGLDEFKDPEFKSYGTEDSKIESNIVCDKKSDASKENSEDSLVKEQVPEDTSSFVESSLNVEKETIFLDKKIEIVKPKNHEKPVKKLVRYVNTAIRHYHTERPRAGNTARSYQNNLILKKVGDEAVHKELGDRMEKATTTASSLEAEQESGIPTDSQQTPINTQPSSSRPQKKQSNDGNKEVILTVPQDDHYHDDSIPIPSNDLTITWILKQVLDLEKAKDAQAKEIAGLKKRVQKLERKKKLKTTRCLQSGGSFEDIDKDAKVSLVDETQGRTDDAEMFDTDDLHGDEVIVDMAVAEKQEQSAKIDEITLAQTLIEIKAVKPKAITTAATTTTTTRPKAKGVVVQEPSEFRTTTSSSQASQPSKTKDKVKAIMIKPEVPLKRKDQVALDEEMVRSLEAQLQAELIEEERLARKRKKKPT
ncbi:hypothetical protein Tco_0735593 [Tanacetum coccineum]